MTRPGLILSVVPVLFGIESQSEDVGRCRFLYNLGSTPLLASMGSIGNPLSLSILKQVTGSSTTS